MKERMTKHTGFFDRKSADTENMRACYKSVVLPISSLLNLSFLYFRSPNLMLPLWRVIPSDFKNYIKLCHTSFFPPQNTIRMLKILLPEQLKRSSRSSSLTINLSIQAPSLGLSVWYVNWKLHRNTT